MAYFIQKKIVPLFFKSFIGKCTGVENLPKDIGMIIAPNHASYLDHFIVGSTITQNTNRMLFFLAKKEHFDTFFQRMWHKFLAAIPIDRQAGGTKALEKAIAALKEKKLITIYPEGTRTLTGKLNRAKTGVARLALASKVPVIPIGVTNTFKMLPKGKWIPKLGIKSDIHVGKPLYFDEYYKKTDDKIVLRKITTLIMDKIAKLSNQIYEYDQEYLK